MAEQGDGVAEQGDGAAAFVFGEKFVRLNTFRIYLTVNRLIDLYRHACSFQTLDLLVVHTSRHVASKHFNAA